MSTYFRYPATGTVTDTVALNNPDYGDSLDFDVNTNIRIFMNGGVSGYVKKYKQILLANYTNITKAQLTELEEFYIDFGGSLVQYEDSLGQTWSVRFMNNPMESVVTIGSGACELNNLTVQLHAVLVSAGIDDAFINNDSDYFVNDDDDYFVYA